MEITQGRIDRSKDGATVATGQDEVGDGCHDTHGRLGANLLESGVDRPIPDEVNDLGALHGLSGGDIQGGHIPANVSVPDNRKKSADRHLLDFLAKRHVIKLVDVFENEPQLYRSERG